MRPKPSKLAEQRAEACNTRQATDPSTKVGPRVVSTGPVAHKARAANSGAEAFVFATMTGTEQKGDNSRKRVLGKAVAGANEWLATAGEVPLPDGLTPHKLRHTFASILVALGVDPGSVMDQLGQTDPGFTPRVYRHGMRRDEDSRAQLVGVEPKGHPKGTSGSESIETGSGKGDGDAAKLSNWQGISGRCPRRESNLDLPLRRRSSYPLDYEGAARCDRGAFGEGYLRPVPA
jgi:Phage integrase family